MMNTGQQPRYLVEKAHEAIIPLEQWQAVQDEIKRRRNSMKALYSSKVTFYIPDLYNALSVERTTGEKLHHREWFGAVPHITLRAKSTATQSKYLKQFLTI